MHHLAFSCFGRVDVELGLYEIIYVNSMHQFVMFLYSGCLIYVYSSSSESALLIDESNPIARKPTIKMKWKHVKQ